MVDDLMRRLEDASRPPLHILRLVRYLVGARGRLSASYRYVSHSPEHVAAALHEAAAEADRIAEAEGRTGMVQELIAGFIDASERRKREDDWGAIYAADEAEEDDSFAEASSLEAGSRWQQAS